MCSWTCLSSPSVTGSIIYRKREEKPHSTNICLIQHLYIYETKTCSTVAIYSMFPHTCLVVKDRATCSPSLDLTVSSSYLVSETVLMIDLLTGENCLGKRIRICPESGQLAGRGHCPFNKPQTKLTLKAPLIHRSQPQQPGLRASV